MTLAGRLAGGAKPLLPDAVFYRVVAAAFRLRPERRLLLDELVAGGGTAVDVGAWWGPWTYWLSRRAASVWSFEPNPKPAAFLSRVAADNVRVESVALSDRSGTATLLAPKRIGKDALATLSPARGEAGAREVEVPLRRLDDYPLEDVRFMKIDVEGHEYEMLQGAEETIERCAPVLLIEIDQMLHEQPVQRIFDWLSSRGYEGRFRRRRAWAPLSSFDLEADQLSQDDVASAGYIRDFVFTPRGA